MGGERKQERWGNRRWRVNECGEWRREDNKEAEGWREKDRGWQRERKRSGEVGGTKLREREKMIVNTYWMFSICQPFQALCGFLCCPLQWGWWYYSLAVLLLRKMEPKAQRCKNLPQVHSPCKFWSKSSNPCSQSTCSYLWKLEKKRAYGREREEGRKRKEEGRRSKNKNMVWW